MMIAIHTNIPGVVPTATERQGLLDLLGVQLGLEIKVTSVRGQDPYSPPAVGAPSQILFADTKSKNGAPFEPFQAVAVFGGPVTEKVQLDFELARPHEARITTPVHPRACAKIRDVAEIVRFMSIDTVPEEDLRIATAAPTGHGVCWLYGVVEYLNPNVLEFALANTEKVEA